MYRWRTILYRIATALGLTGWVVRPQTHQQTLQEVVQVQLPRQALDKVETSDITDTMKRTGTDDNADEARELVNEMEQAARNFKTSPRALQFNLKSAEHRNAMVGLANECQNQGVHFTLRQDGLIVWFEF